MCVMFQRGEEELALGPVYHPSYLSPQQPHWGRARERMDERKLVKCELKWGETTIEGQEVGNEEDDRWQARMGERKEQGEDGQWGKGDGKGGDRWSLQWEWQEVEGRWKKGWGSALIFHRRQFLHTWRKFSNSKVSLYLDSFCLWLYFVTTTSRCKCWTTIEN